MHTVGKRLSVFIALVASITALAAVAAGPAMASVAHWGSSEQRLTTTGVTISNGTESRTCTLRQTAFGSAEFGGNWHNSAFGNDPFGLMVHFSCSGSSSFSLAMQPEATYNATTGKYSVNFCCAPETFPAGESPWGNWYNGAIAVADFNNGSGSTMSTLVFQNDKVGSTLSGGKSITLTGTFTVEKAGGGLETLSH